MRGAPRRYKILRPVGRGAFGTVYHAQMLGEGDFHKDVAIKLMNSDVENANDIARRQRDEARLLGLIRHRAILQVDGLVRLNGCWAVVMEYLDGVNLRQLLRAGPVPPSVALAIVAEIAGALKVAYQADGGDGKPLNIVHRDIKPANIQLTAAGEVKLLDFGAARADFGTRETASVGMILGTLRYMAPERLEGIDGPAGDIYALGIVLAELLSRPKVGRAGTDEKRHLDRLAEILDQLRAHLGGNQDQLLNLVDRCLAYETADRPTAEQLERAAWDLSQIHPTPRIQDWAADRVRAVQAKLEQEAEADPMMNQTLMEQSESIMLSGAHSTQGTLAVPIAPPSKRRRLGMALGGVATFLAGGLLLVGFGTLIVAIVLWAAWQPPDTTIVARTFRPALDVIEVGPTERVARSVDGVDSVDSASVDAREPGTQAFPGAAERPAPVVSRKLVPEPTPTGRVVVRGDSADVVLVGPQGRYPLPANVPPGAYRVLYAGVEIDSLRGLQVAEGAVVSIQCDARFQTCKR